MRKELVDYIGGLLFGNTPHTNDKLRLHSEKQFRVNSEGRLEREQSVLTDIIVDNEAIYLQYLLPDGQEVCFVNAVKNVDCTMKNDYTIGRIVYEAEPVKADQAGVGRQRLLFTLECDEEGVRFYEDVAVSAGRNDRTLFEIQ